MGGGKIWFCCACKINFPSKPQKCGGFFMYSLGVDRAEYFQASSPSGFAVSSSGRAEPPKSLKKSFGPGRAGPIVLKHPRNHNYNILQMHFVVPNSNIPSHCHSMVGPLL